MSPVALVNPGAPLDPDALRRYARQIVLPELGIEGQRRLASAKVLVIGAGGLGSPALQYLAAAGVGTIGVVDDDRVDESNLQRQVIHSTADLGRAKVDSAQEAISRLNPQAKVIAHEVRLERANAMATLGGYDLVIDGSDNFATRYLVADATALLGKPYVWGSVLRFEGQISVFWTGYGPCLRCLFPTPPAPGSVPSCAEAGVIGALPGIIGSMQAMEAIKLICGIGAPLLGRVLTVDALGMNIRELSVSRDPDCALCGENPSITELGDYEALCGTPAVPSPAARRADSISPHELEQLLQSDQEVLLIDVRERFEWDIVRIKQAQLIPQGELPDRLPNLPRDGRIVLYCKSGVRSARARDLMRSHGFSDVVDLDGGINAWAREVDPQMRTY